MRTTFVSKTSPAILALGIASLLAVQSASAAITGTWTNLSGGSWNTGTNWSGGVVPSFTTDDTADLSTLNITANATVTLDAQWTVGTLKIGDATTSSNDWIINAGTGGSLKLQVSTGAPIINVVNRTATINAVISGTQGLLKQGTGNLTLGGLNTYTGTTSIDAGTIAFSSRSLDSTSSITMNGGTLQWVSGNSQDISGKLTYTANGVTFNNASDVSLASAIGGASLSKTGPGTLSIRSAVTYAGATTVNSGMVEFGFNTLNTSSGVSMSNAGLRWATGNTQDLTIGNKLSIQATKTAILDTNGNNVTLSNALPTTTGGILKIGAGTLTLSGANTYSGGTTVQDGTLKLDLSGGADRLVNTTALIFKGGTIELAGSNNQTVASTTLFADTNATIGGRANTVTRSSGTGELHMGGLTRTVPQGGSTVNFAYTPTNKDYAFTTTANVGTTGILSGWATVGGKDWAVGAATNGTDTAITAFGAYNDNDWSAGKNTNITGADLALSANTATNSLRFNDNAAREATITGFTGTITSGGILVTPSVGLNVTKITGGTLTAGTGSAVADLVVNQYNTGGDLIVTSIIADNTGQKVALTKAGLGRLTLSTNASTFTGGIFVNAGALRLQHTVDNTNMLTGASGRMYIGATGALELEHAGTTSSHAPALSGMGVNNDGAIRNIAGNNTMGGQISLFADSRINSDADLLTLSGSIGNSASWNTKLYVGGAGNVLMSNNVTGGLALVKDGSGKLTVTGSANTYLGGTTISQGTLAVGSAVGILGTNNVSLNGGALEVQTTLTLAVNTQLLATATSGNTLKLDVAPLVGTSATAITLQGTGNYDFSLASGAFTFDLNNAFSAIGTYHLIAGGTGNIEAANYSFINGTAGNSYSFANGDLTVQAVPEPGAAMALIGGSGVLLGLRRRTRLA